MSAAHSKVFKDGLFNEKLIGKDMLASWPDLRY